MRQKRIYRRLSNEECLAIVRAYHVDEVTQIELAKRYNVDPGHVCRLVNGGTRPEVYEAVRQEVDG